MTINKIIKNNKLKEEFDKTFKIPTFHPEEDLECSQPISENYPLVGTAFDYFLRFYIARYNNSKDSNWISERTLDMLKYQKNSKMRLKKIISDFKQQYNKYLETGLIEDSFLSNVIVLAKIDGIFRSGGIMPKSFEIDERDVEDLKNLISIIPSDKFKTEKLCFLNPDFGNASLMVGGGDVDIIIGDSLIDIKTTKEIKFPKEFFIQLISYFILNKIGGLGECKENVEIKKLGIYFSRYGYLFEFNVKDVIVSDEQLKKFINLYIDVAQGFA